MAYRGKIDNGWRSSEADRGHDCADQHGQWCACGTAICEHGYEVGSWEQHQIPCRLAKVAKRQERRESRERGAIARRRR